MSWIKRNLYFFIGSIIAVVLMGLAGWYAWSKYDENNQELNKLNELYSEMQRLNSENPHPGSDKVDNIKEAVDEQQQLKALMQQCRQYFKPIPPIPANTNKINGQEFATGLRRTVDELQHSATNASVMLPTDCGFSFTVQRSRLTFSGGLEALALQLGEIKAICDVLFQAKINSLDNLRRERVSPDDGNGPQTDYLDQRSVTNEMAILTPYEISFHAFSSELAGVLSGFSSSPYGIVVKTINVEPAPAAAAEPGAAPAPFTPAPVVPQSTAPPSMTDRYARLASPDPGPMNRYGNPGGGQPGGIQYRPLGSGTQTPYAPPATPAPTATGTAPGANRGGLATVIDEKQLKITVMLNIVKLLPAK
jgi:hypothetical protein